MVDIVNRMRLIAEKRLGEQGRESVERSYASAIDAIHRGDGSAAIARLAKSLAETALEVGGDDLGSVVRSELALVSVRK